MKDFTLTEVKPRIFFLDFKDSYKLSMHFLRYQEFYESPSSRFRGKSFEILNFMEWYSKTYGKGVFTYPIDWAGFNIPGDIILKVDECGIDDFNQYDEVMSDVYSRCAKKLDKNYVEGCWGGKFYIIGAIGKDFAMKHEIAHGFFYTEPAYKKEMTKLVKALKPSFRNKLYKVLEEIGYTPKVYVDECQAYLSTGLPDDFGITLKGEQEPFVKLYNEYFKL